MFRLTDQPIVPPAPECLEAGGFVTFEGRVRNRNEGKPVQFLEYEAYEDLALSEGNALLQEAKDRFGLDWVYAEHRIGKLDLGEVAVWIGCGAAHRKEAFQACEFLIDEMKKRLPIWKREHYTDGPAEWVNLKLESYQQLRKSDLFARQLVMPEVGPSGQVALEAARVLVVGAGGLANGALPYLAAAGVGTIGIVEPDLLESSNLHRQVMFGYEDLGRSKARLAAEYLRRMHPFAKVEVFEERLEAENAARIISGFDIVLDGTDRFDAKFLMNDVCQALGKPLVQASVYRFDGYVQTVLPGGPCLRCQWPDTPSDGCVSTCAEAGVLGVVPGLFGILQATEVLKLIAGFGEPLWNAQWLIDLREGSAMSISRNRRADCVACHGKSWSPSSPPAEEAVTVDQVRSWKEPFVCIDLREEHEARNELDLGQEAWQVIPLSRFAPTKDVQAEKRHLFICSRGARSGRLVYRLREEGYKNVFTLEGGASQTENGGPGT